MNKRNLARAFRKLRRQVHKGEQHRLGICFNVSTLAGVGYPVLADLFVGWPKHSGDPTWPVTSPGNLSDPNYRWQGEQRELRLALIDYCIDKLEGKL